MRLRGNFEFWMDFEGHMQSRDTKPRDLALISSFFPRQKLLSALNDSKVGVVICDRRMRYKALNKSLADIHNVPIEAHLGHSFHEILGSFAEKVVPLWENVFSSGMPLPNLEVTGLLPKRSEVGYWIENLFPLMDDRGRVAQVGCFVVEITPPPIPKAPASPLAAAATPATGHPLPSQERSPLAPLSPREREVVRLVAEGKSNKEISSALAISVRTVETYRARLMLKLFATSSAQLVHYAIRNNLVTI
jgi:DNA-binding CsgD family transcriptional regulator